MKKFLKYKKFIFISANLLSLILIIFLFFEKKNVLLVSFTNVYKFDSQTIMEVKNVLKDQLKKNKINFEEKKTLIVIPESNINIKQFNILIINELFNLVKKKNKYFSYFELNEHYIELNKNQNLIERIHNYQFLIDRLEAELLIAKKLDIKYAVIGIEKINHGTLNYQNGYLVLEERIKLLENDLRETKKNFYYLIQLIKNNKFLIYTVSNDYKFIFKTHILLLVYFINVLLYILLNFIYIKKISKS